MKLKVLGVGSTPENCARRVVVEHDDGWQEWVRDTCDNCFMLWSNCERAISTEQVWDPDLKRKVDVECPYEEIEDEDGNGTGEYREREGLICFPLDMYEHSGRAWSLSGSNRYPFTDRWDTTSGVAVLYVDERRWKSLGGKAEWKFVDGEPSEELYAEARAIAESEVEAMNLYEQNSYYRYRVEERVHEESVVTRTLPDGTSTTKNVSSDVWEPTDDECGGFLTDEPLKDMDFPAGIPVVSPDDYLVGDVFEQTVKALKDDVTGKYVSFPREGIELVDDPKRATLDGGRFLEANRGMYENDHHRALTVVDVTKEVWDAYPECKAE